MLFKKPETVPALLEEGTNWVQRLENAAVTAEDEAIVLEAESKLIAVQAAIIRDIAEEGRTVAANFRKLFKTKA